MTFFGLKYPHQEFPGVPPPPREKKRENNFRWLNLKELFSMIYIYLVMFLLFFHFSFNFKDLGYFNRATMRPLVFKLASQSADRYITHNSYKIIEWFTSIIHMLISNSWRNPVSYGQPSDLVRALLLIVLPFAEKQTCHHWSNFPKNRILLGFQTASAVCCMLACMNCSKGSSASTTSLKIKKKKTS